MQPDPLIQGLVKAVVATLVVAALVAAIGVLVLATRWVVGLL